MRRLLLRSTVALVAIVSLIGFGSLVQSFARPVATTIAAPAPDTPVTKDHKDHDHSDHSLNDSRPESIVAHPRQHVSDSRPQSIPPHPPEHAIPSIDGKTSPYAIPDDHALSLLYRTAIRTDENGIVDDRRLHGYLRHVFKLPSEEAENAMKIVKEFKPQMEAFDRRGAQEPLQRATIAKERLAVLHAFATKLELSFGPNGGQRFAQGVSHVKTRTRVFGR